MIADLLHVYGAYFFFVCFPLAALVYGLVLRLKGDFDA